MQSDSDTCMHMDIKSSFTACNQDWILYIHMDMILKVLSPLAIRFWILMLNSLMLLITEKATKHGSINHAEQRDLYSSICCGYEAHEHSDFWRIPMSSSK